MHVTALARLALRGHYVGQGGHCVACLFEQQRHRLAHAFVIIEQQDGAWVELGRGVGVYGVYGVYLDLSASTGADMRSLPATIRVREYVPLGEKYP